MLFSKRWISDFRSLSVFSLPCCLAKDEAHAEWMPLIQFSNSIWDGACKYHQYDHEDRLFHVMYNINLEEVCVPESRAEREDMFPLRMLGDCLSYATFNYCDKCFF